MDSQVPRGSTQWKSEPNQFVVDFVIWFGSILVSAIPAVFHQIHPIEALINISFPLRLTTDVDITYSFITGITVLTIQLLLIEGRNEFIKKKFRTPVLVVLFFCDLVAISFYAHLSTMEYSEIEILFSNDWITGGVQQANIAVIATIVIVSFALMFFHSLPQKVIKFSIKDIPNLFKTNSQGD